MASIIWTRSEEREKTFLYSDPVVALNDVFFHIKGADFDWQNLDDLTDERIGMTLGYFYGQELDDDEKRGRIYVERASSDLLNLRKLLRGRMDIVAINEDVGYSIIKENFEPRDVHAFAHHPRPFRVVDYHMIVSRNAPNAQQVIDLFNTGLRKLKAEGRYAQIVD